MFWSFFIGHKIWDWTRHIKHWEKETERWIKLIEFILYISHYWFHSVLMSSCKPISRMLKWGFPIEVHLFVWQRTFRTIHARLCAKQDFLNDWLIPFQKWYYDFYSWLVYSWLLNERADIDLEIMFWNHTTNSSELVLFIFFSNRYYLS